MNIYTQSKTCLNDLHTPVGAFLSLRNHYAHVSIFESSTYHSKINSKSFIGIDSIATLSVTNSNIRIETNGTVETHKCQEIETLEKHLNSFVFTDLSTHQTNGFFGLFGHASVEMFEDIEVRESDELPTV